MGVINYGLLHYYVDYHKRRNVRNPRATTNPPIHDPMLPRSHRYLSRVLSAVRHDFSRDHKAPVRAIERK